jgi:gliding motility-associated-like protein
MKKQNFISAFFLQFLAGLFTLVSGQSITNVTVNASSFCEGQAVIVSYTVSDTGGSFDATNLFTAQLSDTSGSFLSPVSIGTLNSDKSGDIAGTIPPGTANGIHYRIRVVSDNPVTESNPNDTDLRINLSPSAPVSVTATPDTICASASSVLNATSEGNSVNWYDTGTGGLPLGTSASGANFTVNPGVTTIYYAESISAAGCPGTARTAVTVTVNPIPSSPAAGTVTQPTCVVTTGSVVLNSLPATGTWTLTISPGGTTVTGTGTSTPVTGLVTGKYTWTVTSEYGCASAPSSEVVINSVPASPPAPGVGRITQPTCTLQTGSVILNNLPTGDWTLTRIPGGETLAGRGRNQTITGLAQGKYTYTVTNASGCTSVPSANIVIDPVPASPPAPVAGAITQPTCTLSTGSVVLNNLPATGNWTLTRTPGGVTTTGTGTTKTITGLAPGTYTYTVTNASGCISISSAEIVIYTAPSAPSAPAVGTITQPTCILPTGSVVLNNLPATGTWTLTRTPGGVTTTGTGPGTTITGLAPGTYNYTVANESGCTSPLSADVVINTAPAAPSAPTVGTITQPTCTLSTASVLLTGLPSTGSWTITITPGEAAVTGTGRNVTVSGLLAGTTYTFKVTNSAGCTSPSSTSAIIQAQPLIPSAPLAGTITAPTCILATGSVVLSGLPASGTWTVRRYPGGAATSGTGTSTIISSLPEGTYNFSVTNDAGCVSGSLSGDVVIPAQPVTPSAPVPGLITQPSCLVAAGSVVLSGLPAGNWTITMSPGGTTTAGSGATATVSAIPAGTYTFTVAGQNGCTSAPSASVVINTQPFRPAAPVIGIITQPTCAVATGAIALNSLPAGSWTLTRNPGGVITAGSGTSTTISGLYPGTYTFSVAIASGCLSASSENAVVNSQPALPGTPVYSLNCSLGFGHAAITVTSPTGTGLSYSLNAGSYQAVPLFTEVENGSHFLSVRNTEGCTTVSGIFNVSCGCINQPAIVLSSISGSICGTSPVTVSGNTFGGSATNVAITENGSGSLNLSSASASPFSFTYTPASGDIGRTVVITVTSDNPAGPPCNTAVATYTLTVNPVPPAPSTGAVTHLTCTEGTGSVVLTGLPSTGTWTVTGSPGGEAVNGTGTSTTISGLEAGTHTFTVTTGAGCTSPSSAGVVINPQPPPPAAPVIGTITHPTCELSVGSAVLSGLPTPGTWTITRSPGGVTTTGTGTTATVSTLPGGTYTFTVTNSAGCVSRPTGNLVINAQPPTPAAPSAGIITPPSCTTATGSVILSGLPSSGTWTLTRYPGIETTKGTGTTTTIPALPSGTYNYTVTNSQGCISIPSANVVIPLQPPTPLAPEVGIITQPTYTVPTGSVVLSGLPTPGTWRLTRLPDKVTTPGTGNGFTAAGLPGGAYFFIVTNSRGCTSDSSAEVIISTPGRPEIIITDPPAVCSPATADLTDPAIKTGSTTGLTYTYWTDAEATMPYDTPASAAGGIYYIKGTTVSGYFDIKPVTVIIDQRPVANAGPDQVLYLQFSTTLDAELNGNETGTWSLDTGYCNFQDITDPKTVITKIAFGNNLLIWSVTNGVCPVVTDTVSIKVNDLLAPTLITPNGDNSNEYFEILGIESLGKTELVIFDRSGRLVYKNSNYDNKWNGVDNNKNPLPDDTYFFILKSPSGLTKKGYIVIRR